MDLYFYRWLNTIFCSRPFYSGTWGLNDIWSDAAHYCLDSTVEDYQRFWR
jgi:hypothetical protein